MIPAGMEPRVAEVYAGFNIWFDPFQGFYWVDGFEPTFYTREEARAFALTQVAPVFAPEEKSIAPLLLVLGAVSALF